MAFITRLRVEVLTTLALFSTRETVAVETFARRATCSRFMAIFPIVTPTRQLTEFNWKTACRGPETKKKWGLTLSLVALTLRHIRDSCGRETCPPKNLAVLRKGFENASSGSATRRERTVDGSEGF